MLPFLEVEHLPSSSSFYSAIVQPLGLRYLATEDGHFPSTTYGFSSRAAPVFQIRQVVPSRDRPLRISRIVISAPSAAAADDAYEFALRANPDVRDVRAPRHLAESYAAASGASAHRADTSGGGTRVLITDFVGNMMEIVFQPPPEYPSQYDGSTVRYTRSTSEEAGRILYWNYDVASSSVSSPAGPSSASDATARTVARRSQTTYPEDDDDHSHPGIRRSVTAGSSVYEPAASARENSNGLSAGAVVGTLLGVAAGAAALGGAFTYMTKGDKSRSSRQEYDMPHFSRRSTYPEKHEGYSDRKPRYVDSDRGVDKVRYQNDYPPPPPDYRRPPPEYITRYSQADSPRSREADDIYVYEDSRGRAPSSRSRASSARPRSESASYRDPYAGAEAEHRSYTSSRSSRQPPIVQRSYTYDTPDRESYVSSRSQRSNSTVRGAPPSDPYAAPVHMSSHSRSGSRVTTTTFKVGGAPRSYSREGSYISARHVPLPDSRAASYISGRDIPLPDSRAPSYMSARDVPLPDSRAPTYVSGRDVPLPASRPGTYVSGRHIPLPASRAGDDWEDDDDDTDSIVPGDSISCVGSRGSGRRHY
jgi:hypothetical protein